MNRCSSGRADDPDGLRAAAKAIVGAAPAIARGDAVPLNPGASRLLGILTRFDTPASPDGQVARQRRFAKQLARDAS